MARLGMDIDAVKGVHTQLGSLHGQLQQIVTSLSTQVSTAKSNWEGNDSNQFENEWMTTHKVNLNNALTAIQEFQTKLQNNINAQESTSSSY